MVLGAGGDLRARLLWVGGEQVLKVPPRPFNQQLLQADQRRVLTVDHAAQVQPHVGDHLIVAAAPGVQLGTGVADQLDQSPFDRHVNVFVLVARHELPGLDLGSHPGQPVGDGGQLLAGEHTGGRQTVRVSHAPLDVFAPQAPVEGE